MNRKMLLLNVLLITCGMEAHAELSLENAVELAQRMAPETQGLDAGVRKEKSAAVSSGRLPDPRLALGIENLPASGDDRWRFNRDVMTMQRIGVMQDIPNRGKRQAQRDLAAASIQQAEVEREAGLLSVRRAVAIAWLDRFYLEKQLALLDELDKENDVFATALRAQVSAGKGNVTDSVAPQQEAIVLATRRDELNVSIVKAKAMLRRWIGDAADQPLATAPSIDLNTTYLREHVHQHLELSVYAPMLQSAQASLHEAEAEASPDWGVELFYSRREWDRSNMVSLQLSIGLPIAKRNRQDPKIEASREVIKQIEAQREQMLREHMQDLEGDIAEYESLTRQYQRAIDAGIPLAQQKVNLQYSVYRSGQGTLNDLLQARRELIEEKFKSIQLQKSRAVLIAKLHYTVAGDQT